MKQADHSNLTIRTKIDSPSEENQGRKSKQSELNGNKWPKIAFFGLLLASIIIICILANEEGLKTDIDPVPPSPLHNKIVEVEVIDGIGSAKVAQHMTNVLRTLGYDVVESKKSNEGIIERSYILDRSGDFSIAQKLAASLGIPKDKVFQKIDSGLYVDLTVVVGKDFLRFKAFQSFNRRDKL